MSSSRKMKKMMGLGGLEDRLDSSSSSSSSSSLPSSIRSVINTERHGRIRRRRNRKIRSLSVVNTNVIVAILTLTACCLLSLTTIRRQADLLSTMILFDDDTPNTNTNTNTISAISAIATAGGRSSSSSSSSGGGGSFDDLMPINMMDDVPPVVSLPKISNVRNENKESYNSRIIKENNSSSAVASSTTSASAPASTATTANTTVQQAQQQQQQQEQFHRFDTAGPRIERGRTYTLPSLSLLPGGVVDYYYYYYYRVSNLQQFYERYQYSDDVDMFKIRRQQQLPTTTTSNSTEPTTGTTTTTKAKATINATLYPQPFYFYNPSIIPIPENYQRYIQFEETTTTAATTTEKTRPKPSYFVSFRVSSMNGCDIPYNRHRNHTKNLLGLAVLDERLDMVPNSDVIIDVVSELPKYTRIPEDVYTFDDFRLITFGGKIFLTHRYFLLQLRISTSYNNAVVAAAGTNTTRSEASVVLQNTFGNSLNVEVLDLPNKFWVHGLGNYGDDMDTGKNFGWLPPLQQQQDGGGGVNDTITTNFNKIYLQRDIQGPRVDLEVHVPRRLITSTVHMKDPSFVPEPSFQNEHEDLLKRFFYQADRGTACCVKISNTRHYHNVTSNTTILGMDHLWVGVSHTKNRKKDKMGGQFYYVSRLYALSPTYELVARSGCLCFGFPMTDEYSNDINAVEIGGGVSGGDPLTNLTFRSRLKFRETEYDCPRIEFVTGISEKVDDPDSLLLGYGVNDCVARIV